MQLSRSDRAVSSVQILVRTHHDYDRHTDTPDKINVAGMVKVATFVKEATDYLIQRDESMVLSGGAMRKRSTSLLRWRHAEAELRHPYRLANFPHPWKTRNRDEHLRQRQPAQKLRELSLFTEMRWTSPTSVLRERLCRVLVPQ